VHKDIVDVKNSLHKNNDMVSEIKGLSKNIIEK